MCASVVSARRFNATSARRPVDRAGKHLVAWPFDRQRFTGDRRLIDVGAPVANDAIQRESLAGLDDHERAGSTRSTEGHGVARARRSLMRAYVRRQIHQRADRLARAIPRRARLEPLRDRRRGRRR